MLRRLVEWDIDVTIADVNGLTALHCAYRGGEKAVIEHLLNARAPENVLDALGQTPSHLMSNEFEGSEMALDALGRALSHSMPEAFGSSGIMTPTWPGIAKSEYLEKKLNGLFLYLSTDSGHGASDSDDEKFVDGNDRVSGAVGSDGRLLSGRVDLQSCSSQHLTTPRMFKTLICSRAIYRSGRGYNYSIRVRTFARERSVIGLSCTARARVCLFYNLYSYHIRFCKRTPYLRLISIHRDSKELLVNT